MQPVVCAPTHAGPSRLELAMSRHVQHDKCASLLKLRWDMQCHQLPRSRCPWRFCGKVREGNSLAALHFASDKHQLQGDFLLPWVLIPTFGPREHLSQMVQPCPGMQDQYNSCGVGSKGRAWHASTRAAHRTNASQCRKSLSCQCCTSLHELPQYLLSVFDKCAEPCQLAEVLPDGSETTRRPCIVGKRAMSWPQGTCKHTFTS